MTTKTASGFESVRPATSGAGVETLECLKQPDESGAEEQPKTVREIRTLLIGAALRDATTAAERKRFLSDKEPAAVVIKVPSRGWIGPVEEHLKTFDRSWKILAHTGLSKADHNPDSGNARVANALATGKSVIGIASDPASHLPRTLISAADAIVRLRPPSAGVLRIILRFLFPDARIVIGADAVFGLDVDDIVAAVRAGSTASQVVELLRRASQRRSAGEDVSAVPDLATAVEFGEAQAFGMAMVQDLNDYRAHRLAWDQCMKGAVFFGDPGNGKSILAAAIARAAGVPLLRYSIGSLFSHDAHLGTVLAAQRAMYAKAAALSPCILMLDECEALPRRDMLSGKGRDWWLPIIDDALLLADAGVSDADGTGGGRPAGVVLLGATNDIKAVDPAFLRPGRFEVAIEVGRPKFAGVSNILRFHLRASLVDTNIDDIARAIEGCTSAEIMDVVRRARRFARHAGREIALEDLTKAAVGNAERAPAMDWRCSVHESGHAVATIVTGAGTLVCATLQSRGSSGGHVMVEDSDDDLETLDSIERKVVTCLAAGAAEDSVIGTASTGSRNDLRLATSVLSHVHSSTSLTGKLFHFAEDGAALEAVRRDPELRQQVEDHLQILNVRARALVERHRDRIVAVAEALRKRRYLGAETIVEIVSGIPQNDERTQERRPSPVVVDAAQDTSRTSLSAVQGEEA